MDRRVIALTLTLLFALASVAGARMNPVMLGGGVASQAGFDCTGYKVYWKSDSSTLDCYDTDDGSTVTLTGVSASASGVEFADSSDVAEINATDGNNLSYSVFEIGFKYKKTGTVGSYAAFFDDNSSTVNNIAMFRDGTSTDSFRIYIRGESHILTTTINTFYDGNEHTVVVIFNDSLDIITLSIDGENPVSATTIGTGYPYNNFSLFFIGNNSDSDSPSGGFIKDFYIK